MTLREDDFLMEKGDENTKEFDCRETLNADCLKQPHQMIAIEAPVIFDKIAIRQSVTRNIALITGSTVFRPRFKLEKAEDFKIAKTSAFPNTYMKDGVTFKKLDVTIALEYDLLFSDGINRIRQPDKALFHLTIDKCEFPDLKVKCFEKSSDKTNLISKINIKVEALAETFGEIICPCTGALILDIGVFFLISCECMSQITIPVCKLDEWR